MTRLRRTLAAAAAGLLTLTASASSASSAAGEVVTASLTLTPPKHRPLRVEIAYPDVASAPGPLPLAVVSHAAGSSGEKVKPLLAQLAQAGYLAVATTHEDAAVGGTGAPPSTRPPTPPASPHAAPHAAWSTRVADLTALLHTDWGKTVPALAGRLDPDRTVVIGQGLGSSTALLLAGARVSWGEFQTQPKVKAIVLLSPLPLTGPAAKPFGWLPDAAAAVSVPVLVVAGPGVKEPPDVFPGLPEGNKFLLFLRHPTGTARGLRVDIDAVTTRTLQAFLDGFLRSDGQALDLLVSGSVVAPFRDIASLEVR